jgi:hypothetical protein
MGTVWSSILPCPGLFTEAVIGALPESVRRLGVRWRTPMLDLLYIGLTIVVFAVLYLILKGVEHFER